MSPFEAVESAACQPVFRPTPRPPLPLYVEPAEEEALLSWLLRLATRLGVSLHTLARVSFGVDDRAGYSQWWCRPNRWLLARIHERTGVSVARLRRMTFERFGPVYRADEDSGRFCGRRFDTRAPQQRTYRFAVCGPCLESDAKPYLRAPWSIGWMAVCPRHGTVLIERCSSCRARLRVAPFTTVANFSPATCTRCGASLLEDGHTAAHPSVVRMQAAVLRGKCEGITELEGLGRLTWKELVALFDVLLGMVWTDLTSAERQSLFLRYEYESFEEPRKETGIYAGRHDSLRFLAWLIEGWPDSEGAAVGRDLLERWLSGKPSRISHHLRPTWPGHPWSPGPHDIEPEVQNRLRELIE
ncbi:MAG: TniQ family protein [Steroidobacteraceae bacterium]